MDGVPGTSAALICDAVAKARSLDRAFALRDLDAAGVQHVHQANQGKADQAVAVAAFCAAKQADAQAFCLEAASAVEGLFGCQVAHDLRFAEWAEMYGERYAVGLLLPGGAVEERESGQEGHAVAAGGQQLFASALQGVGFAEDLRAKYCDLVRADDQVLRVSCAQCLGFFLG